MIFRKLHSFFGLYGPVRFSKYTKENETRFYNLNILEGYRTKGAQYINILCSPHMREKPLS
jgi:hypothetical protein